MEVSYRSWGCPNSWRVYNGKYHQNGKYPMDWKTSKCWYMMGWKSSEKQNEWSDGENPVLNVAGYFSCSQYRSGFLVACLAWAEGVVRFIFVNYSPWFSNIAGWINAIHLGLKCRVRCIHSLSHNCPIRVTEGQVSSRGSTKHQDYLIQSYYIYVCIYKYTYIYMVYRYTCYINIYVHMEICLHHACQYCCWTSTSLMKPKNI
jgi:hypothetical protein